KFVMGWPGKQEEERREKNHPQGRQVHSLQQQQMMLAEPTGSNQPKNKNHKQNERQNMKNQNKANAGRTQIADISVAGKELSEEHLRIVGGGLAIGGIIGGAGNLTHKSEMTCTPV